MAVYRERTCAENESLHNHSSAPENKSNDPSKTISPNKNDSTKHGNKTLKQNPTPNIWETIYPKLQNIPLKEIMQACGISKTASLIRSGKQTPHPRHWKTLEKLTRNHQQRQNAL